MRDLCLFSSTPTYTAEKTHILKDYVSISREDSNVGVGGGGGAGAFTRWLREFRRETYKVNSAGGASSGGGGGGTYHSTAAEDGRRRHSFNAHDKSAHHRADQRLQLQGGGGGGSHVSPTSKTQACRRANSTAAPKSR